MVCGENNLPILLHIHDGPVLHSRLIQRLVEFSDVGPPIVSIFTLGRFCCCPWSW